MKMIKQILLLFNLSVLTIIYGLTIDNQLQIIKSDCYERLAIGERLKEKDVTKTLEIKTVEECQTQCTNEVDLCKSFSFGIGLKGNGTCELSSKVIRETVDLKPIDTRKDTDYDLYIKKLGCKLVLDQNRFHNLPGTFDDGPVDGITGSSTERQHVLTTSQPSKPDVYPQTKPIYETNGYDYSNKPAYDNSDSLHHVQTLIAISPTRPITEDSYNQNNNKPMPDMYDTNSYKPNRPQLDDYQRPSGDYLRPINDYQRPINDYERPINDYHRPVNDYQRPYHNENANDYDNYRPYAPNEPYKPIDTSISYRPHYDYEYGPPRRPSDVPLRPHDDYLDRPYDLHAPIKPESVYERPNYDLNRPYGSSQDRPHNNYETSMYGIPRPINERPYDTQRPSYDVSRPSHHTQRPSYDSQRPSYDTQKPSYDSQRPSYGTQKPSYDSQRPSYDTQKPSYDSQRPSYETQKPSYDIRPTYDIQKPSYDVQRPTYHDQRPSYDKLPPINTKPNNYDEGSFPPFRPSHLNHPYDDSHDNHRRPSSRPHVDRYSDKYGRPSYHSDDENYVKPSFNHNNNKDPDNPNYYHDGIKVTDDRYGVNKQQKPHLHESNRPSSYDGRYNRTRGKDKYSSIKPVDHYESTSVMYGNKKPIITQSTSNNGRPVTSIITELDNACFRRVLAGKCIDKAFVRRSVHCERVEDCQHECANEKRFACEGFNYRLDPTGRGQGDCELLDIPISRLNIRTDIHNSRDYDYYERDRNTGPDCKPARRYYHGTNYIPNYQLYSRPSSYGGSYGSTNYGSGYSYGHGYGYGSNYDDRYRGSGSSYDDYNRKRGDQYGDRYYVDNYRPYRRGDTIRHTYYADNNNNNNQEKSYNYNGHHHHHNQQQDNYYYRDTYEPFYKNAEYDHKSYEPYLPSYDLISNDKNRDRYYFDRDRDRYNYWGLNRDKWGSYGGHYGNNYYDHYPNNKYLPSKNIYNNNHKDWGKYGGSYGYGDNNFIYVGYKDSYDYWGLGEHSNPNRPINNDNNKYDYQHTSDRHDNDRPGYYYYYHHQHHYNAEKPDDFHFNKRPEPGITYLPASNYDRNDIFHEKHRPDIPDRNLNPPIIRHDDGTDTGIHPPFTFDRAGYNFVKDECSLRTATGFRLHKSIVKRFYSVPNIYECKMLCYKEKDYQCRSYAFRYTISLSAPTDNCYLTDKDYKMLNFYTELEPDRDFDIYTMNNRNKCEHPMIKGKDHSDCFWHVRSGQRLDFKVVKDTLNVKSIVDCQIECLRAVKFICRAFSFRFGAPTIGGSPDNCQLTDWPYIDLIPLTHMVPEIGYEIYDRGSYGHGCEPDHFSIRGKYIPEIGAKTDQLCYVGYGSPARLLPQAVRKTLKVNSEYECRLECTKLREETLFQCMSFSYCVTSDRGAPNCFLSDIYQRDLLAEVDYVPDPDSWLFAWDNYNPKCVAIAASGPHFFGSDGNSLEDRGVFDLLDPLHIWRAYSVNGYPCRRGSLCEENREAGFWFCYLEGGDRNTWDYCCRPNHQCGYSEGFPYQWCYVGPTKTQWRKCNDRYYPYNPNFWDRHDTTRPPSSYPPPISSSSSTTPNTWPPVNPTDTTLQPPHRTSIRPDRPPLPPLSPLPPTTQSSRPSLDQYEQQFQSQFLDPPRPGGFGQPRHWPVSYLHKELPFNESGDIPNTRFAYMRSNDVKDESEINAIHNVIQILRNDLDDDRLNQRNRTTTRPSNDTFHIALPLNTNNNNSTYLNGNARSSTSLNPLQVVDLRINNDSIMANRDRRISGRNSKLISPLSPSTSLPPSWTNDNNNNNNETRTNYRRGYVTRTNVKNHGRQWTNIGRDRTEYRIIV